MQGKRRRHVPLRTCIGCRNKRPKRELLRVVRTSEGSLQIDSQGKSAGRGAYFCPNSQCLEAALEPNRLSRALKCRLTLQDVLELETLTAGLLVEKDAADLSPPSPDGGSQAPGTGH